MIPFSKPTIGEEEIEAVKKINYPNKRRKGNFGTKVCPTCNKEFTQTCGVHTYCGSERKKTGCAYKRRIAMNKDKIAKNKDKYLLMLKTHHLYNKYRIRLEDKENMLRDQNNQCLICGNEFKNIADASVDHCHKTNKIRGLLCGSCNRGLGMFKDDIQLLRLAIQYLGGGL